MIRYSCQVISNLVHSWTTYEVGMPSLAPGCHDLCLFQIVLKFEISIINVRVRVSQFISLSNEIQSDYFGHYFQSKFGQLVSNIAKRQLPPKKVFGNTITNRYRTFLKLCSWTYFVPSSFVSRYKTRHRS